MANTAVTISRAKTSPLSIDEAAITENTIKFHVDFSDVAFGTTSTDTVTMTLGATPTSWIYQNSKVVVTTPFAGTTAFTLNVGTTSSTSGFITAQSTTVVANMLGVATNLTGTSSVSLVAIFTNATGGSPGALTAGALDIYLSLYDTTRALT